MRKWTMSACTVLAWCILSLVAAAGLTGPGRLVAQPSVGTAVSSTATSVASSTRAVLASASAPAITTEVTAARAAARPGATWTVRPGDTLSAIAAGLGVRGGWPTLYAANRAAIGPDPGLIRPSIVLVIPGRREMARYTVALGDTLSAIAAALGVRGGWPALYAASKRAIGPDPDLISPGTVLTIPHPAVPAAARPAPASQVPRTPWLAPGSPQSQAVPSGSHPARPAPVGGMPRWLQDVLLAVGVLVATAFIAEPAAALARRRRGPVRPARTRTREPASAGPGGTTGTLAVGGPGAVGPGAARRAVGKTKIILADHERLIVTYCASDHAAYVLTPPGEDPRTVLRAARLVLPEDTYQDLAGRLGIPAAWPLE